MNPGFIYDPLRIKFMDRLLKLLHRSPDLSMVFVCWTRLRPHFALFTRSIERQVNIYRKAYRGGFQEPIFTKANPGSRKAAHFTITDLVAVFMKKR